MMLGVHILLSLRRKKWCTLLPEGTDVHIQQHIHQKDLKLCLQLHFYVKVIVKFEKRQRSKSTMLCL